MKLKSILLFLPVLTACTLHSNPTHINDRTEKSTLPVKKVVDILTAADALGVEYIEGRPMDTSCRAWTGKVVTLSAYNWHGDAADFRSSDLNETKEHVYQEAFGPEARRNFQKKSLDGKVYLEKYQTFDEASFDCHPETKVPPLLPVYLPTGKWKCSVRVDTLIWKEVPSMYRPECVEANKLPPRIIK